MNTPEPVQNLDNEKLLQVFDEHRACLEKFMGEFADALRLFEALQDELDSPRPKADRCISFLRLGVATSRSALDEIKPLLHSVKNTL